MTSRRNFFEKAITATAGLSLMPLTWPLMPKISGDPTSEEFWTKVKQQFDFASGLRYFNNASLGPSPLSTRKATQEYRDLLDEFPSKYMWGAWKEAKEEVRQLAAEVMKVSAEEIALIHNTTEGMNLIARSLDLKPGDEVIVADHEHPSGTIPWQVWQEQRGIKLVRPQLPLMPQSVDEVVDVYRKAITPRTRVISMCHIVNTTGMILPVAEVSQLAHQHQILVAVDGAQGAGMVPLDLHHMGCDFYAASAHKWLFSPKGVGILYARKQSQHLLKPLLVARGHEDPSIRRLENYNTRNLPELLGLGSSISFLNQIGLQNIHQRYRHLKNYFRAQFTAPSFVLKTPSDDELSAAIQVVELKGSEVGELKEKLFDGYQVDCRPMAGFNLNALRFSLGPYITKNDIDYLVKAMHQL